MPTPTKFHPTGGCGYCQCISCTSLANDVCPAAQILGITLKNFTAFFALCQSNMPSPLQPVDFCHICTRTVVAPAMWWGTGGFLQCCVAWLARNTNTLRTCFDACTICTYCCNTPSVTYTCWSLSVIIIRQLDYMCDVCYLDLP